jgi:type IV secretory pathway component VirB8
MPNMLKEKHWSSRTFLYDKVQRTYKGIKNKQNASNDAQHILDNKRICGPIQSAMKIKHTATEGRYMNNLEKFHKAELQNRKINLMKYSPTTVIPSLIPLQKTHTLPPPTQHCRSFHSSSSCKIQRLIM